MDIEIKKRIESIIQNIKEQYRDIIIDYRYEEDDDVYLICHNNSELEYSDSKFLDFVGSQLREQLIENDIYNVAFGYDYEFDLSTKNEIKSYDWLNNMNTCIEYNYKNVEKTINYDSESMSVRDKENFSIPKLDYNKRHESTKNMFEYIVNLQSNSQEYFDSISSYTDEWGEVA